MLHHKHMRFHSGKHVFQAETNFRALSCIVIVVVTTCVVIDNSVFLQMRLRSRESQNAVAEGGWGVSASCVYSGYCISMHVGLVLPDIII